MDRSGLLKVVLVLLGLAALGGIVYLVATRPTEFRDILMIVLFLETLIVIGLLVALILQIMQLVRLIRGEVTPVLDSVRRTSNTVKGTAEFIGDSTVRPMIRVVSAVAATTRFVRAFLGLTGR